MAQIMIVSIGTYNTYIYIFIRNIHFSLKYNDGVKCFIPLRNRWINIIFETSDHNYAQYLDRYIILKLKECEIWMFRLRYYYLTLVIYYCKSEFVCLFFFSFFKFSLIILLKNTNWKSLLICYLAKFCILIAHRYLIQWKYYASSRKYYYVGTI